MSAEHPLHVVLDNCAVHHSKMVAKCASDLDIELIFLRPYSPQMNPIELVWAEVKQQFRKDLLLAYVAGKKTVYIREILAPALKKVKQIAIRAYIDKALREIFE